MSDINTYHDLKVYSKKLYQSLKATRVRLREMETSFIHNMKEHNRKEMDIQVDNHHGKFVVKNQRRYQPLTFSIVRERIRVCMNNRFGGNVNQDQLDEFIESMARDVWMGRVLKQEDRLIMTIR